MRRAGGRLPASSTGLLGLLAGLRGSMQRGRLKGQERGRKRAGKQAGECQEIIIRLSPLPPSLYKKKYEDRKPFTN